VPETLRVALRTRFGGLPAAYWRIWSGWLINRVGTFVEPFLALYLTTSRGLSVAEAGVVLALYGAGTVASSAFGGHLADRIGRRATLAGSMGLSAGCCSRSPPRARRGSSRRWSARSASWATPSGPRRTPRSRTWSSRPTGAAQPG
jgi:MFS family permease